MKNVTKILLIVILLTILIFGFNYWNKVGFDMKNNNKTINTMINMIKTTNDDMDIMDVTEDRVYNSSKYEKATFAGGCFWCMEGPFEQEEGVIEVVSGYSGGEEPNPSYEDVSSGKTQHLESIQIIYDPEIISYDELLEIFWRQIDPTDDGGQFVDRGHQYTTAIFYHNERQKIQAEESRNFFNKSGVFSKPIITPIREFKVFYPAENYHQDYYKKNPLRYKFYRVGSGRDRFLKETWEKPIENELKKTLTPIQYKVTQENGTEKPFLNDYWDEEREGIYVDVVSGEVLFSSKDKYDSGTGWPSFTKPLNDSNIVLREDKGIFTTRTEVRSKQADSHLGHVFDDGPEDRGGLRYCMNSASMRFIPKEEMESQGYGFYLSEFEN